MLTLLDTQPESTGRIRLLKRPIEHEFTIQKSRFITLIAPVTAVEDADELIRERRAAHPNARHTCTALALGTPLSLQRSNDDGEPGGTAGLPMAQALRGRDITDAVAIVTRYFGGVKLGAGGLTRAYGSSVTEALDAASAQGLILERIVHEVTCASVGYDIAGQVEAQVRSWAEGPSAPEQTAVLEADYGADGLEIMIGHLPTAREDVARAIAEISAGRAGVTTAGWAHVDIPAAD
ncbi:IMPACT family protein [Helcobacillus massiliensis]|uniref:Putative YigZ family protein n=1 Tax=Helcobacillus massiliensis TaxID=521392 RepID=A0A839QUR9_9MICO|nr:putative YigZ family protein [Helcobacillus massiliensis]